MKTKRTGPGYKWSMSEKTANGERTTSGYTIDNLDTKKLTEASNKYEQIFIITRDALEALESCCMDDATDRLTCAQLIADTLRQKGFAK